MRWIFGAHGQLAVGLLMLTGTILVWIYGSTLSGAALLSLLFHVSMAALAFGAYSVVTTALGYKATERVEAVVENVAIEAENATVDAENVSIDRD